MNDKKAIYRLDNPRVWRTYSGGHLLSALHGTPAAPDDQFPEEWIMSVVAARNPGREAVVGEGLSKTAAGETLQALINADPVGLLGAEHVKKNGNSLGVLVKLIDSAERLTVQVHPDKQAAKELFASPYGKTECWQVLGGRTINEEAPCVYLGFKEGITRAIWQDLFERQDIKGMLSWLHKFPVTPGETILIEGGVPHAIGSGCLLMEIQEPTDYTIRVERTTPAGRAVDDRLIHQGLGFQRMMDCFHFQGLSQAETKRRWFLSHSPQVLEHTQTKVCVGYQDTPLFKLRRIDVQKSFELVYQPFFYGLYVLKGHGRIITVESGEETAFEAGAQFFVPADSPGKTVIAEEPVELFQFFGPEL